MNTLNKEVAHIHTNLLYLNATFSMLAQFMEMENGFSLFTRTSYLQKIKKNSLHNKVGRIKGVK